MQAMKSLEPPAGADEAAEVAGNEAGAEAAADVAADVVAAGAEVAGVVAPLEELLLPQAARANRAAVAPAMAKTVRERRKKLTSPSL
jgi:hypothetical protein